MAAVAMQLGAGGRGAAGSFRRPGVGVATPPAHRRTVPAAVYWRRRAAVLFMVVSAAFGGHAALQLLGGGPLAAAEAPSNRGGAAGGAAATVGSGHEVHLVTEPVSRAVYVVGSGDTLWTIARALQPSGDVRPLVDALAAGRSGRPLQPGERIVLP